MRSSKALRSVVIKVDDDAIVAAPKSNKKGGGLIPEAYSFTIVN